MRRFHQETGTAISSVVATLDPDSGQLGFGEKVLDLAIESAKHGVGVYRIHATVADVSILKIKDVTLTNSPEFVYRNEILENGSRVELEVAMGKNSHDPGDATIAEITVEGLAEGTTTVSFENTEVGDQDGEKYTIGAKSGSTLEVTDNPVSVIADGEKITGGGQAEITISSQNAAQVIIDDLWTDWDELASENPGGGTVTNKISDEGRYEIVWSNTQDQISVSITVAPPAETYVGGVFEMTVTASNGTDSATDNTVVEIG